MPITNTTLVLFKVGEGASLTNPVIETGTIIIDSVTGNSYIDVDTSTRVQLKDDTKLPLTGGTMTGSVIFQNNSGTVSGLKVPTSANDATNKQYVDGLYLNLENEIVTTAAQYLPLKGGTMTGVLDMGGNRIENVDTPQKDTEAANKSYVDSTVGNLTLNDLGTFTATATGLAAGSTPTVSVDGTTFTFGIPAGASGDSPVKGVDYWTDADKAEIVQSVIDAMNGTLVGAVDENNNIILVGDLADGTYTLKYEYEDGTLINIGEIVLDSNVYYSVTNNLTNCVSDNSEESAVKGGSYSATISANSGYTLSSVVVTMGGVDISSTAVSGGTINIANVTGNIIITAVAEKTTVEITNWIEKVGYTADTRLSLSSGNTTTASGYECTGFIPAKYSDVIYLRNVELTDENSTNIVFYDSEKNPLVVNTSGLHGTTLYYLFVTKGTQSGDVYSSALVAEGVLEALPETFAFIRIGSTSITDESILTVNQEIV